MLFSIHHRTVRLDVEVGNGKVSTLALSNVLYIPSWKEGSLVSWNQLDKTGKVRMSASDMNVSVCLKDSNWTVFTADIVNGLPEIKTFTKHGASYLSAVQYWQEALGHTFPQY